MSNFDRLHPAVQHHVVNSLGWSSLRALQEQAIPPLLDGHHALLIAPTAGGKTEAAVFPLLSRMLNEGWEGLSVLYVCPIKALLNNLEVRLSRLAGLVGRRVELWHGDVPDGRRKQIVREPPDILLTTPESIEVMLIFRKEHHRKLFGNVRALVVDELHAFAGDDRGWHLLALMERVGRIAGREIQRVGLSATIGNPAELVDWLAGSSTGPREVIQPTESAPAPVEVTIDHVGTIENAAIVISRLHRGEKRLVFCDSRSRVERLALELRGLGVDTYVSHSSLSVDERRRAEEAFAERTDCVIVATSTLELGLDVGDLDRIIQIDAPTTVSGFLQRIGRSGRRPGTKRNCLFLTTNEWQLLQAAALVQLWSEGYVEPTEPPAEPYHVLAQQLLALTLQEGRIGRHTWREWIGEMPGFAKLDPETVEEVVEHMVATGILMEEQGMLSMGPEGEAQFGRKNFLEVLSVFTSPPLFTVMHGAEELGQVHESTFYVEGPVSPVLSLAGRSWEVTHLDWPKRIAHVKPSPDKGRSRWLGGSRALDYPLTKAMQRILAGEGPEAAAMSRRATAAVDDLRERHPWIRSDGTFIVRSLSGEARWWTFAGSRTNSALALVCASGCGAFPAANLGLEIRPDLDPSELQRDWAEDEVLEALTGELATSGMGNKFDTCIPEELKVKFTAHALLDVEAADLCRKESLQLLDEPAC